eukprot:9790207-Ditylum_brightwellii.AAC.1
MEYWGMIINPTENPTLDCYANANFTGLWGHEGSQDPNCVKSCTVQEDNNGTLILANSLMPHMTSRSKHIAVEYHWFGSFIISDDSNRGIYIELFGTDLQKGDVFIKPFGETEF